MHNGRTTRRRESFRTTFIKTASICALALFAGALICATSACSRNEVAQDNSAQGNAGPNKPAQPEPVVNWADGNLTIDNQTFKLSHAYATIEHDPFNESEYTIRVLLSEQPISQDTLDDQAALMSMKKGESNHALEIDIDHEQKVTWIGVWGLGQVSGLEYPFEPAVFTDKMVEGRLFLAKPETILDKKWQYDARFKSTVRKDPNLAFITAAEGKPLASDGGEPGRAYMDYLAAIPAAKAPGDLDGFFSRAVLKELNADPGMKELVLEMEKGSELEERRIVGGFIAGDKATISIEAKGDGGRDVKGKVNLHLEDGRWKIGAQAFKGSAD
ncbi:MAG TPA: hypothetical protein VF131_26255 [Blastocatellia bacterium]|nr:hypothetical protein [Blastocatellia bacterium]